MTEEQKVIFELKDAFEKDPNCQPNGTFNEQLVKAIKRTKTWSTDDKSELLALGQSINEQWKSKKLKIGKKPCR
jgi:hypothetical protein